MKQGVSVILLAGGNGTRMGSTTPKQFLTLGTKPIASHSFELFIRMPDIHEIIVVCPPESRHFFPTNTSKPISFALPGIRRQDSVYNGLLATAYNLICIHDAARPFIDERLVSTVLEAGRRCGAAAVGLPLTFTIKEVDSQHLVQKTPDRSKIWEIQTPQVVHRQILIQGFQFAHQHKITVTDDVSLAELIQKPVQLVEGSPFNVKITVPADLILAQQFLNSLKK